MAVTSARRVLVFNAGSSSLKYQLVDVADGTRPARGLVEGLGGDGARLRHRPAGAPERVRPGPFPDHEAALAAAVEELAADGAGPDAPGLVAVGHRVVHGGGRFTGPTLVDEAVEAEIARLAPLAPLHNPANLAVIRAARRLTPGLPHVAVFDTAFHATLPEHAWRYAVDRRVADRHGLRRYGFHGVSYASVCRATAELLGADLADLRLVVLHLGNGASAAAVAGGRSVETSMGLTPAEGLVMGTRCGDLDPAAVVHLARAGLSPDALERLLTAESGLVGLCGTGDMRRVVARMREGDTARARAARLAFDVYVHRLRKYVGAYHAVLGGVDALVFTAGVGEHSAEVRKATVAGLGELGLAVDPRRNAARSDAARLVSPADARAAVAVVPTDEEGEIAAQACHLLDGGRRGCRPLAEHRSLFRCGTKR